MSQSAEVIAYPVKHARGWQGDDSSFFHKRQIRVGVRLVNLGRLSHGTSWEVRSIRTYRPTAAGTLRGHSTQVCEKLADDVTLVRSGSNEVRTCTFAALSYSAIWRLA